MKCNFSEEDFKNEKQNNAQLKTVHNKIDANKTNKTRKTKKSVGKQDNAKDGESSPKKRKVQSEKKNTSSSSEDFNTRINRTSKKSNLNITTSDSSAAEDKNTNKPPTSCKDKTVDLIEEKINKKKQHALMYEKYLQRGGARNPGSKPIPTVRECCRAQQFLIL